MKFRRILISKIFIVTIFAITGCGGGSETAKSDTNTISRSISPTFELSSLPITSEKFTVSIKGTEDKPVTWTVMSKPDTSKFVLNSDPIIGPLELNISTAGAYGIQANLANGGKVLVEFYVSSPKLPYEITKVEGYGPNIDMQSFSSYVKNQSWVYAPLLSEEDIRLILQDYKALNSVGYDDVQGLLVEYDPDSATANSQLEQIKFEQGVVSVINRAYFGKDSFDFNYLPNDYGSFSDGGTNWHLEKTGFGANLVEAWNFNKGSYDISVGVIDNGFNVKHPDLAGRIQTGYAENLDLENNHGTLVTGAIGANTDNSIGMTGINHFSDIYIGNIDSDYLGYDNMTSNSTIKLVNHSYKWKTEDYSDSFQSDRNRYISSEIRKGFTKTRTKQLEVMAAGNESTDSKYITNGGIHYLNNKLYKLDNMINVAALTETGYLADYSNYGESVDIAAPSEYYSTNKVSTLFGLFGTRGLGYFDGTSAAAPVVTGVASLIYSINPDFTPEEVKGFIVESAKKRGYVKHRYINKKRKIDELEKLANPIPILDAAGAVKLATKALEDGVRISDAPFNPAKKTFILIFDSINNKNKLGTIEPKIQISNDDGNTWLDINADIKDLGGENNIYRVSLEGPFNILPSTKIRVSALVQLKIGSNETLRAISVQKVLPYSLMSVTSSDTISLSPVGKARIQFENANTGKVFEGSAITDESGYSEALLKNGDYKIHGQADNYLESTAYITSSLTSTKSDLLFTSDTKTTVGSVTGYVSNSSGEPLTTSSIRISGGAQTNGFFASAITDTDGKFSLSNISLVDANGTPIDKFTIEVSANGFVAQTKGLIVISGKSSEINFTLAEFEATETRLIFEDDFELANSGWMATGFWNKINNSNSSSISNLSVSQGFTSIAPDEDDVVALLPTAYSGLNTWWFGNMQTGNFIGTQLDQDLPLSGGTSIESYTGELISRKISLSGTVSPSLSFATWWEIESVNPNEDGFDIMTALISNDNGETFELLRTLNPYIDPNEGDREAKPYSSAGFNRKPLWVVETVDISKYANQDIILKFSFDTKDSQFNGFRGWFIDSVKIED